MKEKLISLLKNHDWYYSWSDDHQVYLKGDNIHKEIITLVKSLGDEGKKIYNMYAPDDMKLKENRISSKTVEKSDSIMKDLMSNKREFVKRYGKKAEQVMKGRAISMAKNKTKNMKKSALKEAIKSLLKENTEKINFDEFCQYLNKHKWHNGYYAGSILSHITNTWDLKNRNKTQSLEAWTQELLEHIKNNILN